MNSLRNTVINADGLMVLRAFVPVFRFEMVHQSASCGLYGFSSGSFWISFHESNFNFFCVLLTSNAQPNPITTP